MRKPAKLLLTAAAALLLLALALHLLLQPQSVTGFVLNALGDALCLEITAPGSREYRLRGTPVLVVHDVVAREPGAATPLLRARPVYVSVPWSPLRSSGAPPDIPRTAAAASTEQRREGKDGVRQSKPARSPAT